MKTIAIFILFTLSPISWAFNHDVVKGEWAVFQNSMYYYLNIKNDFSGVLVRNLGSKPIIRSFKNSDITKRDGYIEIRFSNDETVILSAWKLPNGTGKLTGQIFRFKENRELYNMHYFPLSSRKNNFVLFNQQQIRELSEKFR